MISVEEVINDSDMIAPEPFTIQRYTGQFVAGGFENTLVRTIQQFGPVRNATDKEVAMLPEADRVGQIRAFFATTSILTVRGSMPVPAVHGEVPQGAVPGTTYTLSQAPPRGVGQLTINGLMQTPGADYTLVGAAFMTTVPTVPGDALWFQWPAMAHVGAAESDIIAYNGERYRVLDIYHVSGSGFFKALGTRMAVS